MNRWLKLVCRSGRAFGGRSGSVATDSLLIAQFFRKRSLASVAGAVAGADLVYRGATGHCQFYKALGVNTAEKGKLGSEIKETAPRVRRSITIGRSPEELYTFWRNERNLARIMSHFAEGTPTADSSLHWRVHGPLQQVFEWNTHVIADEPGRRIEWESLPGTGLPNRGQMTFRAAPNGIGNEVTLEMQFEPPLGAVGAQLAKVLHKAPHSVAGAALQRFKSLMETGEIPTLKQNPSGRGSSDTF